MVLRLSRLIKIGLALSILFVGGLIASFYATPSIHEYLCMAPHLEKADSIVVFCGGSGYRAVRAVALLKKGYSSHLILCGTKAELSFIMGLFRKNVQTQKQRDFLKTIVQILVSDTKDSVKYVVSLLEKDLTKNILVVTGWWHIRRSHLLLSYYAGQTGDSGQIIKRCSFVHEKASEGPATAEKYLGTSSDLPDEFLIKQAEKPLFERRSYKYYIFAWTEFVKCLITSATNYLGVAPF